MTGLPTVTVKLDDGTGTFPYDVSTYVRLVDGITLPRGRSDELDEVQPGMCSLTLDNTDGRFSLGSTIINATSPIYVDNQVRVSYTTPSNENFNLLSANAASMETSIADWAAAGSPLPVLSQSSVRAQDGTKSLLITWQGGGGFPQAQATVSGLTIGLTYTFSAFVYIPSGSNNVVAIFATASSAQVATRDTWTRVWVTFVATGTSHGIAIRGIAPTLGNTCWVDAAMVNVGDDPGDFNVLAQVTKDRFTGYVQKWPVEWPDGGDSFAVAKITAVDVLARLSRRPLRSIIEEEFLQDGPIGLYTLGEPAGSSTAGDTSGNGQPALSQVGTGTAVVFGNATGPGTDSLTAATFAGGKYLRGTLNAAPFAVSAFFATSTTPAAGTQMGICGYDYAFTENALGIWVDENGKLVGSNNQGAVPVTSSVSVNDGLVHHVVVTFTSSTTTVYLDGVSIGTKIGGIARSPGLLFYVGNVPRFADNTDPVPFTGSIAHVAPYANDLSATRALAHANAGLNGFTTDRSDQRISRYLVYAGIPTGQQVLETGYQTDVPHFDITGQSTAAAVAKVNEAEKGVVFARGDGKVVFHNRYHRAVKTTADWSLVAIDLDPTTVVPADMQQVTNIATSSRQGGATQSAKNVSSITKHGQYPTSYDSLLVTTDDQARSRISWQVGTHAEPGARFNSLQVDLMTASPTAQQNAQARELGDRLAITGLPSQAPSGLANQIIEGWTETLTATSWEMTFNTSPWDLEQAWILGDSTYGVLGSTTRLGF